MSKGPIVWVNILRKKENMQLNSLKYVQLSSQLKFNIHSNLN